MDGYAKMPSLHGRYDAEPQTRSSTRLICELTRWENGRLSIDCRPNISLRSSVHINGSFRARQRDSAGWGCKCILHAIDCNQIWHTTSAKNLLQHETKRPGRRRRSAACNVFKTKKEKSFCKPWLNQELLIGARAGRMHVKGSGSKKRLPTRAGLSPIHGGDFAGTAWTANAATRSKFVGPTLSSCFWSCEWCD